MGVSAQASTAQARRRRLVWAIRGVLILIAVAIVVRANMRPEPTPPRLNLTEEDLRVGREALRLLRDLEGTTKAGIGSQEYVARVHSAKAVVDQYLGTGDWKTGALVSEVKRTAEKNASDDEDREVLKSLIRRPMELYSLAALAWEADTSGQIPFSQIAEHPALTYCPPVEEAKEKAQAAKPHDRDGAGFYAVFDRRPQLWACAAENLAFLEDFLGHARESMKAR